jgi:SAM-dependent methyltransferase
MRRFLLSAARRLLPQRARRWLRALMPWPGGLDPQAAPPVGAVRFGSLRRLTPISAEFGYDRGLPVDRYYVEGFLRRHAADVRGRVLEVGDSSYTRRFGGGRVAHSDVLHVNGDNSQATIVADLSRADHVPSDAFDCIVLTQTLHLVYDVPAALRTLYRILAPRGVVLATVPGISQISRDEWAESWYWSFTALSMRHLFADAFPPSSVHAEAHGNVLSAIAFLQGLAADELRADELDYFDQSYPVTIAVRAVKPDGAPPR